MVKGFDIWRHVLLEILLQSSSTHGTKQWTSRLYTHRTIMHSVSESLCHQSCSQQSYSQAKCTKCRVNVIAKCISCSQTYIKCILQHVSPGVVKHLWLTFSSKCNDKCECRYNAWMCSVAAKRLRSRTGLPNFTPASINHRTKIIHYIVKMSTRKLNTRERQLLPISSLAIH